MDTIPSMPEMISMHSEFGSSKKSAIDSFYQLKARFRIRQIECCDTIGR